MSAVDTITAALRHSFCAAMDVSPVPIGYAISTGFLLPDGDHLSFYLIPDGTGRFRLEDDGTILPNAVASGLDLKSPVRESLLRGLLADEGAHYDADLAIRTDFVSEQEVGPAAVRFISALIRTRDLALLSRENVAASFADDVREQLVPRLPSGIVIDDTGLPDQRGPDLVLKNVRTGLNAARVYAAGGDLRLMDALVEYQSSGPGDSPVIAVVDRRKSRVSEGRFNTATNRGMPMAVVDGLGSDWVQRVLSLATDVHGASSAQSRVN